MCLYLIIIFAAFYPTIMQPLCIISNYIDSVARDFSVHGVRSNGFFKQR